MKITIRMAVHIKRTPDQDPEEDTKVILCDFLTNSTDHPGYDLYRDGRLVHQMLQDQIAFICFYHDIRTD